MSIRLGYEPIPFVVFLAADTDFTAVLVAEQPWAAGTAIALLFNETAAARPAAFTWPAAIDAERAAWSVPAEQVAVALAAGARHVRLSYAAPGGPTLMWARGRVQHG